MIKFNRTKVRAPAPSRFSVGKTTPKMPSQQTQRASQATLDAAQAKQLNTAYQQAMAEQRRQTSAPQQTQRASQATLDAAQAKQLNTAYQRSFGPASTQPAQMTNLRQNSITNAPQQIMTSPQYTMLAKGGAVKKKTAKMAKGGAVAKTANCGASMKPAQKRK